METSMSTATFWGLMLIGTIPSILLWFVGFQRTGRVFSLLAGMGSLFLAGLFGIRVFMAMGAINEFDPMWIVISRTVLTTSVLHFFLAADAYVASTNGHWSIVAKIMCPIERAWERRYGEEGTSVTEYCDSRLPFGGNGTGN
jgi:hypothetical protein